jgi:hypothetical protein
MPNCAQNQAEPMREVTIRKSRKCPICKRYIYVGETAMQYMKKRRRRTFAHPECALPPQMEREMAELDRQFREAIG